MKNELSILLEQLTISIEKLEETVYGESAVQEAKRIIEHGTK